jgi:hypothetical protein
MFAVFGMGGWEMVLVLAILIVLFSAKKMGGWNRQSEGSASDTNTALLVIAGSVVLMIGLFFLLDWLKG